MKPSDVFGVAVRAIGMVLMLYSCWEILGGIDNFLENLFPDSSDSYSAPTYPYFIFGVPAFIVGAVCFFLADWIVKMAYRD